MTTLRELGASMRPRPHRTEEPTMNPALNREASEAQAADLRRRAGRDAIALAAMRASGREPANTLASIIRAGRRALHSCRIRRRLHPGVPGLRAGALDRRTHRGPAGARLDRRHAGSAGARDLPRNLGG